MLSAPGLTLACPRPNSWSRSLPDRNARAADTGVRKELSRTGFLTAGRPICLSIPRYGSAVFGRIPELVAAHGDATYRLR
eukprot:2599396-Rhodomonas_salina.1